MRLKIEIETGAQKAVFEGEFEADTQTDERDFAVNRMIHLCNSVFWDDFEENERDEELAELIQENLNY
jgi:hypothetical protein